MAATVIVASHAKADELGVPLERRAYLHGWCYADRPRLPRRAPRPVGVARHGRRQPRGAHLRGHRHRRRRPPRPLQLLRQLRAPRLRRPRPRPARRPRPHRHRRPPVLRRRRQQLHAAQHRHHARRAPRRPRLGRAGHRRRHAHDQARLRPLLHRSPAAGPRPPARRRRGAGEARRHATDRRSSTSTPAPPRSPATPSPTPAAASPSGAWSSPTSPTAPAPTAASRTPTCCRRWRPRSGSAARSTSTRRTTASTSSEPDRCSRSGGERAVELVAGTEAAPVLDDLAVGDPPHLDVLAVRPRDSVGGKPNTSPVWRSRIVER